MQMENKNTIHNSVNGQQQFCTFRISNRLFGVDILDVKEINTELSFTPIHHAPEEVRGLVNIRGQIYLVLDLRRVLGFSPGTAEESTRLILFKQSVGEAFGVLVDSIGDVVSVDRKQIEERRKQESPAPSTEERRRADFGKGVCKLDEELLVILDPAAFLFPFVKNEKKISGKNKS